MDSESPTQCITHFTVHNQSTQKQYPAKAGGVNSMIHYSLAVLAGVWLRTS